MTRVAAHLLLSTPTRPALRWHGGKWRLAPWIIGHFPPHRVYVEPYGGAASVLLRKERSYAEVYNDLDDEVVTLFRVLRDERQAHRLIELLRLTPFARTDFNDSYTPSADPIERARNLIIRSFMGFGTCALRLERTGFRANTTRSGTTPAQDWAGYPDCLAAIVDRLRGVVIENADARAVMTVHDAPTTLHYVDPPYVHETRSRRSNRKGSGIVVYRHEMDDAAHADLLEFLRSLTGMVVLSGYPNDAYDRALTGWTRVEKATHADGARPRTEVLWINRTDAPLFAQAAE